MGPSEKQRLDGVLLARKRAEGVPTAYGRYLGAASIALASLELVSWIPMIVPYALVCLGFAIFTLLAYLRVHRATERRTAALRPRSIFTALPFFLIVAMICAFATTLVLATYPPARLGALAVAAATLILGVIAWRVAAAPALLVGDDPQWEYAVDQRVRLGRSRSISVMACALPVVLVSFATRALPDGYRVSADIASDVVFAALIIAMLYCVLPLWQRMRVA